MTRLVARLAVAAFLAATAGLGVPGPARAATCSTSSGVTVVVDYHQLGGGVQTACDLHGAGRTAATQLTDAGHTLTYVQRQPGFVCRVDGAPSSDPCVNTPPSDAYWSLWWSDGKSGTWSYSSLGVGSLKVPAGGYIALSWQGGGSRAAPRVTPKAHASPPPSSAPTSHPTTAPTTAPTSEPTQSPTTAPTTPTVVPSSTATHHPRHGHSHGATSHHSHPPSASPTQQADPPLNRAADSSGSGGGLPGWVAPGVVAVLFAASVAVAAFRRKRSGGA